MTPDEQETRARAYSDEVIILVPLKSGRYGVLNAAREFCGIVNQVSAVNVVEAMRKLPKKPEPKPILSLEDIGL